MGHGALGIGNWELGIGHWALGIGSHLPLPESPSPRVSLSPSLPLSPTLYLTIVSICGMRAWNARPRWECDRLISGVISAKVCCCAGT